MATQSQLLKSYLNEKFSAKETRLDKDEEYKKYRQQLQKQQQATVQQGLKQGLSWEDISSQGGIDINQVRAISQKINPGYGIGPAPASNIQKIGGLAKGIGEAFVSSYDRVSKGAAEVLGGGAQASANQANALADQTSIDLIRKAGKQLQDPNVPAAKKAQIRQAIQKMASGNLESFKQQSERFKQIQERTDPVKGAAAVGSIGFDVLTAGTIGNAAKAGRAGLVARGATEGAVSGGLSAVEQKGRDVTLKDVAQGAAVGGAIGGGLTAGSEAIGKYIREYKAGKISKASEKFAKENPTTVAAIKNAVGEKAPTTTPLDNPQLVPTTKLTSYEGAPDRVAVEAYKARIQAGDAPEPIIVRKDSKGNLGIEDGKHRYQAYKELGYKEVPTVDATDAGIQRRLAERPENLRQIEQATTDMPDAQRLALAQGDTGQAGLMSAAPGTRRLNPETGKVETISNLDAGASPTLSEDIQTPFSQAPTAPGTSIPMAAQRLEADALKADLAPEGGFNIPATTNMKMEDQINKAIVLMDNDFDTATKVAMGKVNAPADLQSSVVFEAVKQRAIKNKDKMLLYELSKSDVPSQGKAAGQFIKGFDTKNAEDPVATMQRIVKARKDSKIPGINKDLTVEEVGTITDMSDDLVSKKAAMADTPVGSKERLAYGQARVAYDNYVNELEAAAKKRSLKDRVVQHPADSLNELAGAQKGILAALDNSAIFRQGWKTMWTNPKMWTKNMLGSFKDIKGGLTNKNMIDALKADIISRPNFELYKKAKLAVSDIAEEAFPSTLPERIPALGRAFKASEYAYTGFLQRQRADVFDKLAAVAKAQGKDLTDPKELQALGNYVNTLTGRANLGKAEPAAKYFNNIFFSPRNFWANVQTLTGNQLQRGVTPFVRKQAALNLLKIAGGTASVLATANFLRPGSVEWDPRSSDFGKIKIGNTRFDASGGMASLITISSRILPTMHNGQWGNYKKSSSTDTMSQYNTGKPGDKTTWDAFLDFGEGKLSPAAQVVKQLMTGEDFTGGKVSPAQAALDSITPLPFKNFQELQKDPNSANTLIAMIADGLGIGANTYGSQKDWNQSDSKRVNQFKQFVDERTFVEANTKYNEQLTGWLERLKKDSGFNSKPIAEQQQTIRNKQTKLMTEVMKSYGFKYKQDTSNKDENERLMGL